MQHTHPLEQLTGLYSPEFEKANCGFGMIANLDNTPSSELIKTAIGSLSRMTHRGGVAADQKTGDGCGILLAKPDAFFRELAALNGHALPGCYAVGMMFLNQDADLAQHAREMVAHELEQRGLNVLFWDAVRTDSSVLGEQARASLPVIEYLFVTPYKGLEESDFNRHLFMARRQAESALSDDKTFYVVSLNSSTIGYKGLMMPSDLPLFYQDLQHPLFASTVCSYHQRFSTNTLPQWALSQPFRYLAHNGELNTINGNRNWASARRSKLFSELIPDLSSLNPIVSMDGSDSASLDNMLEVLIMGGSNVFRSLRLLIPPAWQNITAFPDEQRAFFEFHSMHMEPWDGPAGLVIHDGKHAICALDRNGLRPTRYVITKDRNITFASEIGVFDYAPEDVVEKGRVLAGQMMAVDLEAGRLLRNSEINNELAHYKPYRKWLNQHVSSLSPDHNKDKDWLNLDEADRTIAQKYYQITFEEKDQVLRVLAETGQETIASMGDDTPFPVFSKRARSAYDYFRQMFAQVTNPPIDSLRESIVMSLRTAFGKELSLFHETKNHAKRIEVPSPILSPDLFAKVIFTARAEVSIRVTNLSLHYWPKRGLENALKDLCNKAEAAAKNGTTLIVLDDRHVNADLLTLHAALATGAVHHRLIEKGLRTDINIMVATATARDPHHFAVLIGYGATAVYPWLAFETIKELTDTKQLSPSLGNKAGFSDYVQRYLKGIDKGLLKILSKIGISTIASYRGAQLFESVGLADEVVDLCFKGTTNRIQGTKFQHFEADQKGLHRLAFNPRKTIDQGGLFKYVHGGEEHAFNPEVVTQLRLATQNNDGQAYRAFAELVNGRSPMVLRDLLSLQSDRAPIDITEVEPVESILSRFDSAGISLGALSPEAHESLAIAMNRLGARSNSGEGGEDIARYGTEKVSKIKQIASGRFGVTPHYLVNAEVLQIKVAQGAKPGEGGQLPGHKVDDYIGKLRHANPGTTLISPPPHHDIYSIEDLAQLIFDLKQVNPSALVSVKLVSAPGVGTVAAGVVKAYADLITISGYDGGTGASPLTSVKYAGSPFELGLAEAHQVLRANDLRGHVRIQADGGLKTGLDVLKAAVLGAESFGFGTAPMIALGCKYLRICHLNTCAVGVATQNARLRKEHFIGLPEMVMNYFRFVAQDVRQQLADLGFKSLKDLIGQTQYAQRIEGETDKQRNIDLSRLLAHNEQLDDKPNYCEKPSNSPMDQAELAHRMLSETKQAIENGSGGEFSFAVRNTDRSIGAMLSGEIAKKWGDFGMESNPIKLNLTGVAGQSFGVWNAGGLHLYLKGDANDYVGKGMAGGRIVISPAEGSTTQANRTPIVGNTCLYGATGGTLYASGTAGERFAVRNSGTTAIIEGVGDHGCEYMTGGEVVVLGATGLNFGAGMSGGVAFVYDKGNTLSDRINPEMIELHRLSIKSMPQYVDHLMGLLTDYFSETDSKQAQAILKDPASALNHFWLVKPKNVGLDQLWTMLQKQAA